MIDTKTEQLLPAVMRTPGEKPPIVKIALAVLVVGLAAILYTNKGLFLAAIVNGKPIYRWQLNQTLMSRFGSKTLDGMISEALINDEAKKAGVSVSQEEIDARTKSLVDSVGGGMSLDDLLAYQGMTRADFESQLRLQMLVEKLLGKDITVSDDEVTNYIATESATLTATDDAHMKEEAKQVILSQKINLKLQPWFADLKAKANIMRFL